MWLKMTIIIGILIFGLIVSNVLILRALFVLDKAYYDLDGDILRLRKDLEKHAERDFIIRLKERNKEKEKINNEAH